jgi:hypothetical protein
VVGIHIVSILNLGGEIFYFDCHIHFLPPNHPFRLDSNSFKKDNIVLKRLPRHLTGLEITDILDNLVLDGNGTNLLDMDKSIIGPINVDCVNSLMSKN